MAIAPEMVAPNIGMKENRNTTIAIGSANGNPRIHAPIPIPSASINATNAEVRAYRPRVPNAAVPASSMRSRFSPAVCLRPHSHMRRPSRRKKKREKIASYEPGEDGAHGASYRQGAVEDPLPVLLQQIGEVLRNVVDGVLIHVNRAVDEPIEELVEALNGLRPQVIEARDNRAASCRHEAQDDQREAQDYDRSARATRGRGASPSASPDARAAQR